MDLLEEINMKNVKYFKKDYPRVQFYRDSYLNLDGKWDFRLDYENQGEEKGYFKGFEKEYDILVPFSYNCEASLVHIDKRCDSVWYQKNINFLLLDPQADVILHLEGSDYITTLYVNGHKVDRKKGCTYRQSYDITEFIHLGNNLLVIHCQDSFSKEQVRGKQRWKDHNFECYYKETTGIYKTVWLEYAPKTRIESLKIDTDYDKQSANLTIKYFGEEDNLSLRLMVEKDNKILQNTTYAIHKNQSDIEVLLNEDFEAWDVFHPALYELTLMLYSKDKLLDEIHSYFGIRNIEIKDAFIYLNGKKLYQKLLLDQGYWDKSEYTAPSTDALLNDINAMIQMGFNGARKHQKVEDERYLYYADALGFLVWAEMPSMYENTEASRQQFLYEWEKVVKQQYNHPSIITWTPLNESWGIEHVKTSLVEQKFTLDVYNLTKKIDPYRPVITNDGWEHTISDILTLHHYEQDGKKLNSYYNTLEKIISGIWPAHHKGAFADGYGYKGQPILISEFGGCAFSRDVQGNDWGYGESVESTAAFLDRFQCLIDNIKAIPLICGYCYTQLTDVQQEVNGLFDASHHPKFNLKDIADIQSDSILK